MYVYVVALIPIFYFLYKYIPCKEKQNIYESVLTKYKPERKIDFNNVKNHSQCIIVPFIGQEKKTMTHRVFKTIEFTTVEMFIRLCMFKLNTKDEYIQGLINEKIRTLILKHLEVFPYSDDLAVSFVHKVYLNLCRIDTDLFSVLAEVNKQLFTNLKVNIDESTLVLPKNFFWTPELTYDIDKLISYIKFIAYNRTF